MRRRHGLRLTLWIFFCSGVLSRGASGGDAQLPAGVKAVWDLGKAYRETTATRERISINGLWRWQPAGEARDAVPAGGRSCPCASGRCPCPW